MRYDVVIVGASVAGLYLGQRLSREGLRTCIVDMRDTIGTPVRCGEATGNRAELERFVPLDNDWIAQDIQGLAVHPDGGTEVRREIPDTGLILHRDRFEQFLAESGSDDGMEIRLSTPVTGLAWEGTACRGVYTEGGGLVEGYIVVGADGAESRVGRWAGITTTLSGPQAFPSIQYTVKADIPGDRFLHFFVGNETIPRGYLWVFPKGEGIHSIGAGLFGIPSQRGGPRRYLDAFLTHNYPDAPRTNLITGCVPLALCPRRLWRGNVVVVGDAARQCNPITAGGIMNTLEAADLLASEIIVHGAARGLERYSRRWSHRARRQQKLFLLLKEVFLTFTSSELRGALDAAGKLFSGPIDRTRPFSLPLSTILRLSLKIGPRLLRFAPICWK